MFAKIGRLSLSTSGTNPLRADAAGSLITMQGGKYSEAAEAGRLFHIANQAAVAVTAALATTYTGLAVGNPVGSGVNLSLVNAGYGTTVVGVSVGTVGLMDGLGSITASLTPANALSGGPASKALATAGQTIGTPVLKRVLGITGTGAVTTWQTQPCNFDLDGSMVIAPGYFVAFYCFALATAALQFSLTWEEKLILP